MNQISVLGQQHAGAGLARVRSYPCAITRGSWLTFADMTNGHKPQPRRFSRIS